MRFLLLISILFFSFAVSAQRSTIEANFEKNKTKYTREFFGEGEDASSGYDYVYYRKGDKIMMIRSIWSASWSKELRIEDFYFDDGLVLLKRATAPERQLGTLKRGRNVALPPKEELHFAGRKLTKWIVGGKLVPTTDLNWSQTEADALAQADGEQETFKRSKESR